MRLLYKIGGIFLVVLLFFSCQKNKNHLPEASFYHWKSYWNVTASETEVLDTLKVKKLYVRYFDVGWSNGAPQPLGKIVPQNTRFLNYDIIPTFFITNETFLHLQDHQVNELCDNMIQLIHGLHPKISPKPIQMLQFDCDWTQKTKGIYFQFLKTIQEKTGYKISVTIRLHQVKYKEKTGVPPAHHFVLMCYNTGNVGSLQEKNSILNPQIVEQYISDKTSYPHSLEVALPLFQWGVLFRDGKMIKLIRNVAAHSFQDTSKFSIKDEKVEILKGTYLNGYYLYPSDEIRLENVSLNTLSETVDILKKRLHPQELIFYHLDSIILKTYPYETLENIQHRF